MPLLLRLKFTLGIAACLLSASACVHAQGSWPNRPIKFIVASSAGGGTDTFARQLGVALSDVLGQQVVIENRPGASGNIGAAALTKAAPDGYTFLVSANTTVTINSSLFKGLTYDPERDFVGVARVFTSLVLVVQPGSGLKTMKDFLSASQKEPGKWSFGSAGVGSTTYLGVKLLEEKTGTRFVHVPYKGVAPAFQDLLGGQIQFMMPDVTSALPFIKSGKLVPLAVEQRTPLLPGVPPFADAGLQEVNTQTSFSLIAPTGTPQAVIERLDKEWSAQSKTPQMAGKLEALGLVPDTENLQGLSLALKKERDFYAAFIKRNGIVASD
jgi:tripartite-type tricarboxylate transporter receptor subunit TctC